MFERRDHTKQRPPEQTAGSLTLEAEGWHAEWVAHGAPCSTYDMNNIFPSPLSSCIHFHLMLCLSQKLMIEVPLCKDEVDSSPRLLPRKLLGCDCPNLPLHSSYLDSSPSPLRRRNRYPMQLARSGRLFNSSPTPPRNQTRQSISCMTSQQLF